MTMSSHDFQKSARPVDLRAREAFEPYSDAIETAQTRTRTAHAADVPDALEQLYGYYHV